MGFFPGQRTLVEGKDGSENGCQQDHCQPGRQPAQAPQLFFAFLLPAFRQGIGSCQELPFENINLVLMSINPFKRAGQSSPAVEDAVISLH